MPSRKWWAARVTALTGLATLVATAGAWTQEATIMAITLVSAAALAYLLPNEKDPAEERGQTEPITLLIYVIVAIVLIVVLFKVLEEL
jgi:flagellin-like protein